MKKTIKIYVKQFHTPEEKAEAQKVVKEKGLQEFNSLSFQFGNIPEGEHEIDPNYLFSNQYNTIGKDGHNGYRIFEYCECLTVPHARPAGHGYYIAEGIEELRKVQKQQLICGYCGKRYNKKARRCSVRPAWIRHI